MRRDAEPRDAPGGARGVVVSVGDELRGGRAASTERRERGEDLRFSHATVSHVSLEDGVRIRDRRAVRGQGDLRAEAPEPFELREVLRHVTVHRLDENRAFARDHVARDEKALGGLVKAQVSGGVARRVQRRPSLRRRAFEHQLFPVLDAARDADALEPVRGPSKRPQRQPELP